MSRSIDNTDDIIDSRDVIKRIEELQAEREDLQTDLAEIEEELEDERKKHAAAGTDFVEREEIEARIKAAKEALAEWEEDNGEELKNLTDLAEQGEGYGDWDHGEALIRDSYFKEYAEQLADDIGAIDGNANWPLSCIDWDQAADELKMDYTSVEFDGVTYWMRS